MTIPKVIHQIWLSESPSDALPPQVKAWVDTWTNIPGFEHKLWRNEVYDEFGGKEKFLNYFDLGSSKAAQITDVLRILLIAKYGGFYADCDCEYVGTYSLDYLTQCQFVTNFVGYQSGAPTVYNEFFGSIPQHRVINALLDKFELNRKTAMVPIWKYGYQVFGEVVTFQTDIDMSFLSPFRANLCFKHHMMNSWTKQEKPHGI